MTIEEKTKQEKDEILKKDFKVAQYLYIAIYISLVIALIAISL